MTAQRIDPLVTIEQRPRRKSFVEAAIRFMALEGMKEVNSADRLETILEGSRVWRIFLTEDEILEIYRDAQDRIADRLNQSETRP